MIEEIESLPISGNVVEDANVEASLEVMKDKINELVKGYNKHQEVLAAHYPSARGL